MFSRGRGWHMLPAFVLPEDFLASSAMGLRSIFFRFLMALCSPASSSGNPSADRKVYMIKCG